MSRPTPNNNNNNNNGGMGIFNRFMMSGSRYVPPGSVNVTFSDVAGCEESKAELKEVVDFLKFPERLLKPGLLFPKEYY